MTLAFVAKMLFYPAYVVVALIGLQLDPVAFLISFTLYFITLHLTEALYFKSLFARAGSTNAERGRPGRNGRAVGRAAFVAGGAGLPRVVRGDTAAAAAGRAAELFAGRLGRVAGPVFFW